MRSIGLGLVGVLAAGCAATTHSTRGVANSGSGVLLQSNGRPVAQVALALRCGDARVRHVVTDHAGRFNAGPLPAGRCDVRLPAAPEVVLRANVGANLLHAERALELRLPPRRRVVFSWQLGTTGGQLTLDDQLAQPVPLLGRALELVGQRLVHGAKVVAQDLVAGQTVRIDGALVRVVRVEQLPHLPLGLRGAPRGDAVMRTVVRDAQGALLTLGEWLGTRSVLLVARCGTVREGWLDQLDDLTSSSGRTGLRAALLVIDRCQTLRPSRSWLAGGAEASWALGARPGQVLLVSKDGRVLRRGTANRHAPLADVVAYLERDWGPYAALRRVSIVRSESVSEAECQRLRGQAEAEAKAGRHAAARSLLERALKLSPDDAEARKARALLKAKMGDLSGAIKDVSWWRSSFGDEAAEELLGEIRRQSRTTTLR